MTDPQYVKGYAAGKRCAVHKRSGAVIEQQRQAFKQAVVLAILPELMRSPWKTGEKQWDTAADFARGAFAIAEEVAKLASFSGEVSHDHQPPPSVVGGPACREG